MSAAVKDIRVVRNSLYIEPISSCNLHCRMCYANVVNGEGQLGPTLVVRRLGRHAHTDAAALELAQLALTICRSGLVLLADVTEAAQTGPNPAALVRALEWIALESSMASR